MGKILVADDEPAVREALSRLLEADGHEVVQAEDGEEAIAQAKNEHPDVILLDNVMPKLNGIEVLRTLRQYRSTQNIPVIMVTVKHGIKDRDAAVRLGVVDYINKPWMSGEIELRVKWALKGSGIVPAVPWDLAEEEGIEAAALRIGWGEGDDKSARTRPRTGISPGSGVEIITPDDGGSVETQDGKLRVDVPSGAVPETMALDASPVENGVSVIPASLRLRMGDHRRPDLHGPYRSAYRGRNPYKGREDIDQIRGERSQGAPRSGFQDQQAGSINGRVDRTAY